MEKISWLPIQLPFLMLTPDVDMLWESFNLVFKLPHSRLLEKEADVIGLRLMARAGFNATHAPPFFRILNKSSKVVEWTSTHPVGETRATEVSALLAADPAAYNSVTAKEEYEWPDLKANYIRMKREAETRKARAEGDLQRTSGKTENAETTILDLEELE
jgi:predicted Zn-dependent protease